MAKNFKILLLALSSGLLVNIAYAQLSILIVIISMVPIFILINKSSKRNAVAIGFFFGIGIGLGLFSWMIKGVSHYTGNNFFYGAFVFIISCVFTGLYFALLFWIIRIMWISNGQSKISLFLNRLSIAATWAIMEFGLSILLKSFPLHNIRIGFPFVANLYSVQLVSIGGLALLSYLTVLINVFIAEFFIQKKKIYLGYSLLTFAFIFIIGGTIFYSYKPNYVGKEFKVAIVSDNTNPETKWNPENGNLLADKYFQLCKKATLLEPDFIIWPESAIPWTYSKDDDLLKEIVSISSANNTTHVMGINSQNTLDQKLYNSIFYIDKKNNVTGIYHKQILLKGIEQPLGSFLVPFLSQEGYVLSEGNNQQPIETSFGKAGNLICNEVGVEDYGSEQVRNGANFIFNLSNDGWFKDTYISDLHIYYARLQAVEARKDISVANNCGVNGIISSDGSIISQEKNSKSSLIFGSIQPNDNLSIVTMYPQLFPILFIGFIVVYLLTQKKQYIRRDKL